MMQTISIPQVNVNNSNLSISRTLEHVLCLPVIQCYENLTVFFGVLSAAWNFSPWNWVLPKFEGLCEVQRHGTTF